MEKIVIRQGSAQDVEQVMDLVRELALYERAPHEVTNTEEQMRLDGFGENPAFGLFVAEIDRSIIGIALHYVRYSTWKGKMLYLEDIVVRESHRGYGIGSRLFEACMQHCLKMDYAGMSWQVLDWNEPALRFYKKYDALLDSEWVNGKLTSSQMVHYFGQQSR
ncbi:MAG: GNAT family N-acetyltransferase [Flavobacteriales bacterium]|jgi:GNAT superfamily N-acetyltransferase